jgi:hypothetical protein
MHFEVRLERQQLRLHLQRLLFRLFQDIRMTKFNTKHYIKD